MVSFTARGLMPPVFTPLNDDLTINYGAIPPYAKFLADSGIKSVLVGGTTGEHMSLAVADRKKVIDAWVAAGKSTGLHIQVQVGGAPLADVTELVSSVALLNAEGREEEGHRRVGGCRQEHRAAHTGAGRRSAPR
ncbi:hypothetical protein PYW07_007720 [Mythimna separata]|uniref:N-acetylneuraminate lyase n=1 Tax=Mythimna separata TaxID=271217 RepID=A0AAD8DV15_MYTSE|nr:hypothetical protein PYW07_007720 [Mythimna separata]